MMMKFPSSKKHLGQHFLRSQKILERIVEVARINKTDTVLEVGPGRGSLTKELARRAERVVAVEKDRELVLYLQEMFRDSNVEIIEGDILRVLPTELGLIPGRYKIVANLPYYITSRFLRLFLEPERRPSQITLMVQREVALRLAATPPAINLLALSVQAFGKVRVVEKIPRTFFRPAPKVDSMIVTIENIGGDFFKKNKIDHQKFFALAKKAFSQKRKTLKNSLGVSSSCRPQELSLEEWARLTAPDVQARRSRR